MHPLPNILTPGSDGTLVPEGLRCIRMANEPKLAHLNGEALRWAQAGKAIPSFFELSTDDKKHEPPRLSVWIESLTTIAEAWTLVGANPKRNWVVFLHVDDVRKVCAPTIDTFPVTPHLEVEWESAMTLSESGERVPEMRDGWQGHAGIRNLDQGNKTQREALRWQLADIAIVQILGENELSDYKHV